MQARKRVRRTSALLFLFLALSFMVALPLAGAGSEGILGRRLTDRELNEIRGGYLGGFAFGISFTGSWDTSGQMTGSIVYSDTGNLPPSGSAAGEVAGNGFTIQAYVGDFQGASGVFQIIQSPGSYNVLNNNLWVAVTIVNVTNEAAFQRVWPLIQ
jgi:hypothetical protein